MPTLFSLLATNATQRPAAPAVGCVASPALSHQELFAEVRRTITGLTAWGIKRTDRIALVVANGPDAALAFLGAACAATAAPLNPAYAEDELKFYLQDLRARLVVTDEPAAPAATATAAALGIPVVAFPVLQAHEPIEPASVSVVEDDVALVLHTSGTTARPKIVPLTHRNLASSAHAIAASLHLTATDRCLNIMPLFHVHGLVGAVLASLSAGSSVICTPGFAAEDFHGWMKQFTATWYTGVPTMHQSIVARIATTGQGLEAPQLRFVRSCSSALPPTLMAELEQTLRVPVIEAYGMTEAAHQVASNPLPPRRRQPGSVGIATGTETAVMDEAGALQPVGTTGEIVIRGAGITRGYESPPEANKKAFVEGWFRTGDLGHIDPDGYIFLTGRSKEIVNRGGEKVSPREVDELLLQHPAVTQAVAFALPHPTLGEDLAAAVVLRPGSSVTADALRDFALARLAGFKVPSAIVIVEAIPKGPTGKLQRIGLAEKLAAQLTTAYVAPRHPIETLIADILQEVLGTERVGMHDNFFARGGDSLRAGRVVARVNELFATELTVTSVFHHPTVERFAAHVASVATAERIAAISATMRELDVLTDAEVEKLLEDESR